MVKLFLGNRAGVLLFIPIIIGVYVFFNLITNQYAQETTVNLGLWGKTIAFSPVQSTFFASILICLNALLINWIYNTNQFLERNSYLSALLYIVLMSFYHSFYGVDGLLIAHTCIVIMLFQIFKLRQNEDGRRRVFNGALFAGLAASFHPPMVILFPFIMIMIWNIRPFIFRETILSLVGFIIPLIYSGIYLWYSGKRIELKILEQTTNYTNKQTDFLITAVLFTLLFLLSLIGIQGRIQKSSIRLKKNIRILYWLILVAIIFGVVDFIVFGQIERFSFLMIPLSFFLTFSFSNKIFGVMASVLFYLTMFYSLINFFI